MITFLVCLALLIVGYFTYGKIVNNIIGPDDSRPTPAHAMADGVDYVVLPTWKVLLTQFLNIAGVGPIFGAIMGAMFGPIAFLWITFGCLFVGGVHDILSGYVSMRHEGKSISEIIGIYLGPHARILMRVFSFVLLMLVGVVFTQAPANWLAGLGGFTESWGAHTWIFIIIGYYVFATVVPVHLLMAKLFPAFSIMLLVMCVLLFIGMIVGQINGNLTMQEFTLDWVHPQNLSVMPFIFVTIACGAVSGFHSTKSPMMARCINKETDSQKVFYGAMVLEGIVALIWAAVTIAVVGDRFRLGYTVGSFGGQGGVVDYASEFLLGPIGILVVIIAILIFPITSGDTTFRSIRLMFADIFKWNQSSVKTRLLMCVPMFAIAIALTFIDFNIIWRYFAWSNLTLAALALWTGAAFLLVNKKLHWIASIPALLLTYVSISYIVQAPEGFQLSPIIANISAAIVMTLAFVFFMFKAGKVSKSS